MTKYSTYAEYLQTPEFKAVKAIVMRRSGGRCENTKMPQGGPERCNRDAVDPHHTDYCKWGDFDPPENLLAVCRECHESLHKCESCGCWIGAREIKAKRTTCFNCYCLHQD